MSHTANAPAAVDYSDLLREQRPDHSPYLKSMATMRKEALDAERALGGPVYISDQRTRQAADSYAVTFTFRRRPPD
jgi:hypothetical protein